MRNINIVFRKIFLASAMAILVMATGRAQDSPSYFVYPSDDSYVRAAENGDENYSGDNYLYVKSSDSSPKNSRMVHIRFDVRGMNISQVGEAFIKLYCIKKDVEFPIRVYGTGDNWDEETLTWNIAPAQEDSIGILENLTLDAYNVIDVSDYVQGQLVAEDSIISIQLVDSTYNSGQVRFHSKEGLAYWPMLVLAESEDTGIPSAPAKLMGTNFTATSMELYWDRTESELTNGVYMLYQGDALIASSADTSFLVDGLTADSYYDFYLSAMDAYGNESEKTHMAAGTLSPHNPIEDVYVRGGANGDKNYGGDDYLYVKDGSEDFTRKVLLKFDVSHDTLTPEEIVSAKLRLYCTSTKELRIKAAAIGDNNWADTITWNNAPVFGDSVAQLDAAFKGEWSEWDLTDYVKSVRSLSDTISLGLYSDDGATVRFNSMESMDKRPRLYILSADDEAPTAPGSLSAMADTTEVALSWEGSTDNVAIEHYLVYNGDALLATLERNELFYLVEGLDPSTLYEFLVRAEDRNGNLSEADTVQVTTLGGADEEAPTVPADLEVINISLFSADLLWSASSDNYAVSGYMISLNGDSLTTVLETAYSMIQLIPNTSYLVEVQALDAAGNISDAATANFSTLAPPDFIPPTTPGNLEASYLGNGSVALSWDASTDNIGVVNYRVYQGSAFKGAVIGTTYSVDGLVEGESYTFYVSAVDDGNNESAKAEATVTLTDIGDDQLTAPRIWAADRCIHMETGSSEKVGVSVYNIQGSEIFRVELSRGQKMVREMETPGLYIVTTSADNQLKSHKIVIQ